MKKLIQLCPHILICLFLSACNSGSGNFPPVAVIDGNLKTYINEPLILDGTKSIDPNGDTLSFFWELSAAPSGSEPVLADENSPTPLFITDKAGPYEVTLIVSDGKEKSEPEVVKLLVFKDNITPIADAGEDRNILITDTINLDGRNSADPLNSPLSFSWSFKSKPDNSNSVIENASSSVARFKPDVPHSKYEIQLVVSNGNYQSSPDTLNVNILNSPPVADAGENNTARPDSVVYLQGSGTDIDNDVITQYSWRIVSNPGSNLYVYLENPDSKDCILHTDPEALGDYIIELKVFDGQIWSNPDTVVISTVNSPPNVYAGQDRSVGHCYTGQGTQGEYYATSNNIPSCPGAQRLTLAGTASDPDGDILTLKWTTVSRPQGAPAPVFLNDISATTEVDVKASSATILGDYVFRLTATDYFGKSSYDDVKITVTNRVPSAGYCASPCSQTITRSGCTAAGNLCYTQPIVTVTNINTKGTDPDNDPLFNEFYLAPSGGSNCVYSYGTWCWSGQTCQSSLELRAFAFVGCSSSSTWAGGNIIRFRFKDGFGAQYDDATNDYTITVNCLSCN